jgi:hypothetical protein
MPSGWGSQLLPSDLFKVEANHADADEVLVMPGDPLSECPFPRDGGKIRERELKHREEDVGGSVAERHVAAAAAKPVPHGWTHLSAAAVG